MPDSFGQRLSHAAMDILLEECHRLNLSFEDIGAKAHVDRSTVSRSLRKERNPTLWVFADLATAIGLDPGEVLTRAMERASAEG